MTRAVAALLALLAAACASVVAGIYILFGPGWSLIGLGGALFSAAAVLRRGLTDDG